MATSILVALITGGLSLLGTVLTVLASSHKTEAAIQVNQAVMTQRLDDLTKTVEKHNSMVERTYELEKAVEVHGEQIKVANHRIDDLEQAINKGVA